MGIDYECRYIFGISFSYDELVSSLFLKKNETIIKKIGTNKLTNVWCEYGYYYTSPFYDAEEEKCEYFIGYILDNDMTIDNTINIINQKDEIEMEIKNFCESFKINKKDIEPRFIVRPHIW